MAKIFGYYHKNIDRAWFESSNVFYCECLDRENDFKKVKVTFNNGSCYEYDNVKVQDYLLFRDDASQGKALQKYIKAKNYPYKKLDNSNINELKDELEFRTNGGTYVTLDDSKLVLLNGKDEEFYRSEKDANEDTLDIVCEAMTAVGVTNIIKK